MKKIIITFLSLLAMAGAMLSACQSAALSPQPNTAKPQGAIKVIAVETFLSDIAQNVAGDRLQVETLMPLGLDPHAFEPTPQDVAKIADSQVLIVNGAGFEEWLNETIQNTGGERRLIEAAAGLTSREAREGEEIVLSPQEKAEQACAQFAGQAAEEEVTSGMDAAAAVELHDEHAHEGEKHEHEAELLLLKLNPVGSSYSGFVRLDVAEEGEFIIAANGGTVAVTDASGAKVEAEEILALNCAGLKNGILLDMGAGEYVIALNGLAGETTPFFAGPAGGHHYHEGDPHFWLDPLNVVKYVENVRDGLIAADPTGKDIYTQNAAAYIAQLNDLDQWIKQQIATIPEERRLIVTNHESFGYFADRYGFKIIGTIIPSVSTNASPSAQQLARLVDHIRATQAVAIFLETGSNPQLAQQVSEETGVKVVSELFTHSITGPDGKAPSYIAMMKYNVQAIVDALK